MTNDEQSRIKTIKTVCQTLINEKYYYNFQHNLCFLNVNFKFW